MPDLVLYERHGDAIWLTMNRPEVRNALSREHIAAIRAAMERAVEDAGARAIVLAALSQSFALAPTSTSIVRSPTASRSKMTARCSTICRIT